MVTTKQKTRKQHYYPQFLLKYFVNSNNQIHAYVRQKNEFKQVSYKNVCCRRNTYETDKYDNKLENKLSKYEAKMSNILNEILSSPHDISISTETQDFIFKFMILQSLRTDSGRLSFINHYLHSIIPTSKPYKPRTCPYELQDVKNNPEAIKLFNHIFQKPSQLESFFDSIKRPNFMKFYIALTSKTSKNLITSDNPVIMTHDMDCLIMPISPNICFEFVDRRVSEGMDMIVLLNDNQVDYLNKATINTSMYFVMSNNPFTKEDKDYIRKRFDDPKSILKPPFVHPKI